MWELSAQATRYPSALTSRAIEPVRASSHSQEEVKCAQDQTAISDMRDRVENEVPSFVPELRSRGS
jgi:hypothetical protein